jgi:hypothetical protein
VRAIAAFVEIDTSACSSQTGNAARFLSNAREARRAAGFDAETVRIAAHPFPRYTKGMTRTDAMAFLQKPYEPADGLGFSDSIGPAMLSDTSAAAFVDVPAEALSRIAHATLQAVK